jgi:ribosomal protein S18 acetylase RimI-like enzyme
MSSQAPPAVVAQPGTVTVAGPGDVPSYPEISALVAQLSSHASPVTREVFEKIVHSDTCQLLIVRNAACAIVGMLVLALLRLPSGVRAKIEDVVVDANHRGRGFGRALTVEAIRIAAASGARDIDLTSSPSREAAIRLYQNLGFSRRDTTVFRLKFNSP